MSAECAKQGDGKKKGKNNNNDLKAKIATLEKKLSMQKITIAFPKQIKGNDGSDASNFDEVTSSGGQTLNNAGNSFGG